MAPNLTSEPCATDLHAMAIALLQTPDGETRVLELARALSNKGRHQIASELERLVLSGASADGLHQWRNIQNNRAPANQFLLLNDARRTHAFKKALDSVIEPGMTVLEIGTGSGVLSMMAAKAGASRVYTCEHQAMMSHIAEKIIQDNGFEGTIKVINRAADDLELGRDIPARVDLILCDVFTGSLLEAGGMGLMHRTARSFLKSGGRLLPQRARLRGQLVGGEDLEALCRCSNAGGFDLHRFNLFSPVRLPLAPERFRQLTMTAHSKTVDAFDFLIGSDESAQAARKAAPIQASKPGLVSGFLEWTELELASGVVLSGEPRSPLSWPRFLHVFPEPMELDDGQSMTLVMAQDGLRFSVWPADNQ